MNGIRLIAASSRIGALGRCVAPRRAAAVVRAPRRVAPFRPHRRAHTTAAVHGAGPPAHRQPAAHPTAPLPRPSPLPHPQLLRLNDVSTALALRNSPAAPGGARRSLGLATGGAGGELTDAEYHVAADAALEAIEVAASALDDTITTGFDLTTSSGVLNLALGDKGTFVINKQSPNKQIWWSSPVSGPKRFAWDAGSGSWVNTRDGTTRLFDLLTAEVAALTGVTLQFDGQQQAP